MEEGQEAEGAVWAEEEKNKYGTFGALKIVVGERVFISGIIIIIITINFSF